MAREIKFKVWDILYKVFIPLDSYAIITTDFKAFGIMLRDWRTYKSGEYFYPEFQIPIQYTGECDKYNKGIYEGDVVICIINGNAIGDNDTIGFKNGSFWLTRRDISMSDWLVNHNGEFEVIRNIYEQ